MKLYGISSDWSGAAYRALLAVAQGFGGYCVLVCRQGAATSCLDWLAANEASLHSRREALRWPGTIVFDDTDRVTLFKFRITSELVTALGASSACPFEWIGPDLPEDLSFLRSDGRPWFISIAHERDAFFKLEPDEVHRIEEALGDVQLVEQGDDQSADERF